MTIQLLTGKILSTTLRTICDKVTNRLWIAVPFIGNINDTKRLLGQQWLNNIDVEVKLITDIRNTKFINKETIELFRNRGAVQTLAGLHAKVYIADSNCLITSANLSGTAFSRRHEIGYLISETSNIELVYETWWNLANPINWNTIKTYNRGPSDEPDSGYGLPVIFGLPNLPESIGGFKDFPVIITKYKEFAGIYQSIRGMKRLHPTLSLLQEVDLFLNFLFHEHPKRPSKNYDNGKTVTRTESEVNTLLNNYLRDYKKWLAHFSYEDGRYNKINEHQKILKENVINSLSWDDIRFIADSNNALNSNKRNKALFLNPRNNSLTSIRSGLKELLFGQTLDPFVRMKQVKLKGLGPSSKSEILAYYYPEKYPIINNNPLSGLRLFGYNIKNKSL